MRRGKYKQLIGKRFGKLTVIEYVVDQKKWLCKCDCGNIKITDTRNLTTGDTKSCGCLKRKDLTGQTFGKLTVVEYIQDQKKWLCECECGNTKITTSAHLMSGDTQSCGCSRYDNLVGMTFGKLKVIKYVGSRYWECKCDCGNIKNVFSGHLKSGISTHCGCMTKRYDDLTGKRFGLLIAKEYVGRRNWKCECDCGNITVIRSDRLKNKNIPNCGCLDKNLITTLEERDNKFYVMWRGLKSRCDNVNNLAYHNYGGRGITYDPRWAEFVNFKKDMYFKYIYSIKHLKLKNPSIERIDFNGNYCKENCIFIEFTDQNKNTRSVRLFTAISPEGKIYREKNVAEFSFKHNLNSSHIYACIDGKVKQHKGWKFRKRIEI